MGVAQVSVEIPIVAISSVYQANLYKEGYEVRSYDSPIEDGTDSYPCSTLSRFSSMVPQPLETDELSDT